jgi:hypothetical protein
MRNEAIRAVKWTGQTPAEFFQQIMQNPDMPLDKRIAAAQAGSPLVHQKQPEAHEISGQINLPIPIIVLNDHN